MESRWYFFPGQTVENTKISERSHALHITSKAWGNITKHLDRKKLVQEAIEKEARDRKYLEEGSKSMIQNWNNSLENIRRKKEEERLQSREQKKEDRIQKFFALRKEQEKIRKEYVDNVKKKIYMNTGNARELTGALITSETLYEREKQIGLSNIIKKYKKEEEDEYSKIVNKNAENELIEKLEKEKQLQEQNRQYRNLLRDEVVKKEQQKKQARQKQLKNEVLDHQRATQEYECLQKSKQEEIFKKKKNCLEEQKKLAIINKARQQQMDKEENELNEVIDLYRVAKYQIDCLRNQREKEAKEADILRRDRIGKIVMAEQENKDAQEEARLKQTIVDIEALDEVKQKSKKELQEKIRQDRINDRKHCIEREQAQKKKEREMKKWEMLNRFKIDENNRAYEINRKKEQYQKILEYKKILLEQADEVKSQKIKEKEIEQYMATKGFVNEDERFFSYAEEILQLATDKGRPSHPIEKVIKEYKKNNMLMDKNNSKRNTENSNKNNTFRKCKCSVAK